ncbi:MAG: hypothetical protein ACP5JJ_15425 [Anaerolineae bacterium]
MRPRWILLVLLVPFIALGLLVVAIEAHSLIRYDPAYFADEYLDQYSTPSDVARTLEVALRTGDDVLLAELQALRWPAEFETGPSIVFTMLWERTDRYLTYLYVDMQSYERHPYHLELVHGRYVVAPEDLHYFLYSGQWKRVFFPLAIIWWVLGLAAVGLVWLLRVSEGMRARLCGE